MKLSSRKNPILIPALLVVYAIVMGVISFPRYQASGKWGEFFGIIGACVVLAIALYFLQKRRNKMRSRFRDKSK